MEEFVHWASVVSSVCAVAGLLYAGYQFGQNAKATRQAMYLAWLAWIFT